MSEYEIELVLEATPPVVGEANGFESALDSLDEAIRQFADGHRVRRGAAVVSERVAPQIPR